MSWGREGLPSLESTVWVMGRESPRTQFSDGIATSEFRIIALAMHDRLGSRQRSLDHLRQDCSGRTAFLMVVKTRDILEAFVVGLQMKLERSTSGTD